MSSLQTTPGSTDTAPQGSWAVPHVEGAPPIRTEVLVLDSLNDPRRSTHAEAAEFWRRLSLSTSPDVQILESVSGVDMWRPWQLLQPAYSSLVLWSERVQPFVTSAEPALAADLGAALCDLDGAAEEAEEEGFPQPSELALKNARRLLRDLYRLRPSRLEVYPTPDGEIALVAPAGRGRSVLVLCDSDGGVLCSVNLNGLHRRARYSTATMLPDGFVREALNDLDEPDQAW